MIEDKEGTEDKEKAERVTSVAQPATGETADSDTEKLHSAEDWSRTHSNVQLWFNGLLLAATAIYAGVSILQMCATQDAADAAKKSADAATRSNALAETVMKLTYRGRLYFRGIPPAPDFSNPKGAVWRIDYENGGRGPVTNIWERPIAVIGPGRPPMLTWSGGPDRQPESSFRPPLKPKDKATASVDLSLLAAQSKDVVAYMEGREFLTVQVLLEYTDEFGDSHVSSICVTYDRRPTEGYGFSMCPKGNY